MRHIQAQKPEPATQASPAAQPSPWLIFLFLDLPPFFSFYRSLYQISISPVCHSPVSTFPSCSPFPVSRSTSLARWKAANPGLPGGGKDSELYPKRLSHRYQRKSQKTARGSGTGENSLQKAKRDNFKRKLTCMLIRPRYPCRRWLFCFSGFSERQPTRTWHPLLNTVIRCALTSGWCLFAAQVEV